MQLRREPMRSVNKAWVAVALFGLSLAGCHLNDQRNRAAFNYDTAITATRAMPVVVFARTDLPPPDIHNSGKKPARFFVNSGNLPPGLELDQSSGRISGVPTKPGEFESTISVQLDDAAVLTTPLMLRISDQTLQYSTDAVHALALTAGETESGVMPSLGKLAEGVTPHFAAVEPASLPDGLTIEPNTGRISGTPTHTGLYDIKVGLTLQYQGKTRTYIALVPCWVKARGATSSGGVRG